MYEPVLDAPFDTIFVPEAADIPAFPSPPIAIAGSQENPSQTYAVIATEGSDIVWFIPPHVGGLVATGKSWCEESPTLSF